MPAPGRLRSRHRHKHNLDKCRLKTKLTHRFSLNHVKYKLRLSHSLRPGQCRLNRSPRLKPNPVKCILNHRHKRNSSHSHSPVKCQSRPNHMQQCINCSLISCTPKRRVILTLIILRLTLIPTPSFSYTPISIPTHNRNILSQ